ncbi:Uncharacterized mitochondrial protein AtMg00810 [Striga hermonthica]|uniref:Uncharacterized mitochondrial protein AtMg00810 n=1 Tax=Striga hermonthica TaxID=68872 RepID=A0A9N7MM12_STRHE|nr:Uncharacterized mitochondrial protein AtMg00810 [Striga hermonthica]
MEKVLQRFGMNEAKPVNTPLANHFKLSVDQCPMSDKETQDMVEIPYASAVGCLMYAMVCTRPDLAHAVGQVFKYMSRPDKQYWEAVKWIFRYLKGTVGHGIVFEDQRLDPLVIVYVDSDYAGDLDNRPGKQHWKAVKWIFRYLKGTAGHGIMFGDQRLDPVVVGYVDSDYAGDLDNRRSTTGKRVSKVESLKRRFPSHMHTRVIASITRGAQQAAPHRTAKRVWHARERRN